MKRLTIKNRDGSYSQPTDTNFYEIFNKLGEMEDVLEKYKTGNLDEYISALDEARNFAIKERNAMFSKYIKETIKTEELETELAELKQKAIVPKFGVGQEVYIINKEYYYKKCWDVEKYKIVGIEDKIDRKEKRIRWYTLTYGDIKLGNRYKFQEKDVFATKKEAAKRLAEIKGEKDE